jgi:hypothetical protein
MSDKALEPKCESGCVHFTGGEIRHDKHCAFYPESMTKIMDDLRTQLAERDAQLTAVCAAGQEVVNRWDSPSWKWDDEHTGHKVHRLRDAITATRQPTQDKE